jgi:ABC-type sugar transport system ATPase subunit
MRQQAAEQMHNLGIRVQSIRQAIETLSGGQRQAVAVARAAAWGRKVVILDEPTAALGVAQTRQVLDLVRRLAEQGLAVVLISHNMYDVFEVADYITVLRLGHNVKEFKASETTQRDVVEAITAGELSSVSGRQQEAVT